MKKFLLAMFLFGVSVFTTDYLTRSAYEKGCKDEVRSIIATVESDSDDQEKLTAIDTLREILLRDCEQKSKKFTLEGLL